MRRGSSACASQQLVYASINEDMVGLRDICAPGNKSGELSGPASLEKAIL